MRIAMRVALMCVRGGLAAGCATQEYYQAEQVCSTEWEIKIPPQYQQVLVNRTRAIKIPDGTSKCTTTGNTTTCKQGMRTEWIPYTEAQTVDLNQRERDQRIAQCTQARCTERYGNPDCKK